MNQEVIKRIKECWIELCRAAEGNDALVNSTMLVAKSEIDGREAQMQLRIELDEDDFVQTGHGEIDLVIKPKRKARKVRR